MDGLKLFRKRKWEASQGSWWGRTRCGSLSSQPSICSRIKRFNSIERMALIDTIQRWAFWILGSSPSLYDPTGAFWNIITPRNSKARPWITIESSQIFFVSSLYGLWTSHWPVLLNVLIYSQLIKKPRVIESIRTMKGMESINLLRFIISPLYASNPSFSEDPWSRRIPTNIPVLIP